MTWGKWVSAAWIWLGIGLGIAGAQPRAGEQTAAPAQGPVSSSPAADTVLTPRQEQTLLEDEDQILHFVSRITQLPIKSPVKCRFVSRQQVNAELRKKFDEDKDTRRMERSELVLKKFGLLDQDFQMRPFLLRLLTEQIAGYYDDKTRQMTLLNWVPIEEQKPVMAHELTHALQDQKVDLKKWENHEIGGTAKNVNQDNLHIANDDTDTAREAVLEGQAMVSFADYMLAEAGHPERTLKDVPRLAQELESNAGDMTGSPVLARAPLVLQQSLLFPYTYGLAFEDDILSRRGTGRAFSGVLEDPPSSSFQVMTPTAYLRRQPVPLMKLPDIHPLLKSAGFVPYDVGVMGELDVSMTAELFGGRPLAQALAPEWDGGVYYAAQRKDASADQKKTTASLAILYSSQWKQKDSARTFFHIFEEELPRQYDGLKRRQSEETSPDERVYSTSEGDVLLSIQGKTVWVSEGFDLATARKLRSSVDRANVPVGSGPVMQAGVAPAGQDLLGGLVDDIRRLGVMRAALQ